MAHINKSKGQNGHARYDVCWRLPNGGFRQKRFHNSQAARTFLATVTLAPVDTKAGKVTFSEVTRTCSTAHRDP
jgi:hypothetical protein